MTMSQVYVQFIANAAKQSAIVNRVVPETCTQDGVALGLCAEHRIHPCDGCSKDTRECKGGIGWLKRHLESISKPSAMYSTKIEKVPTIPRCPKCKLKMRSTNHVCPK